MGGGGMSDGERRRRGQFRTATLLSAAPEFLHCERALHKGSVGRSGTAAAYMEDKGSSLPAQTRQEKNVSPQNQNKTKQTYASAS